MIWSKPLLGLNFGGSFRHPHHGGSEFVSGLDLDHAGKELLVLGLNYSDVEEVVSFQCDVMFSSRLSGLQKPANIHVYQF